MNMFAFAYINGGRGVSTKLMVMSICKICAKFYLVYMAVSHFNGFAGDSAESMIVAFVAVIGIGSAADDFMHMLLAAGAIGLILSVIGAVCRIFSVAGAIGLVPSVIGAACGIFSAAGAVRLTLSAIGVVAVAVHGAFS